MLAYFLRRGKHPLQRKSQQDWANREYVQLMTSSITRIADFLNTFHRSCSGRLASLDERLNSLERKVVFLETKVGQGQDQQISGKVSKLTRGKCSLESADLVNKLLTVQFDRYFAQKKFTNRSVETCF